MAKIIEVVQYEAADGSRFLTEAECDAHDFKLLNGAKIEKAAVAYVNTVGAIDRSRNMQINTISNFLAFYLPWVEAGEPDVERTVFDTPKEAAVEVAETAAAETAGEVVDGEEAAAF